MFLALKEMRRAKVRFGLLMAAVGLLVFLILFQQTLQYGLLDSFVGAIRNQSAPVLVFPVDGRRNLQGSVITPDVEAQIRSAPGVGRSGRIGQRSFTVTAGDQTRQIAMVGYEDPSLGAPSSLTAGRMPSAEGEVVASDADARLGFAIGDTFRIEPGGLVITVVGQAPEAQLFASPTVYGSFATYGAAVRAGNPDALDPLPSVIGVEPASGVGVDELVANINAVSPDLDALARADAADLSPGVAQIKQSFQVIFLLYGLVVPFVTGLFFLIITFQKAGSLTLLRALGAPAGRLVSSLLIQVVLVILGGVAIGTALYAPLSSRRLGSIGLRFQTGAVVFWGVLLLLLGMLSALFAARRVLKIEPVAATTGAGVDR